MAKKLEECGYESKFHEFKGNHTAIDWRGPLADGLSYLLKNTKTLTPNKVALI